MLLVYDISQRKTFSSIKKWFDEARYNGHEKMTYMLIGNKCDLGAEYRIVV